MAAAQLGAGMLAGCRPNIPRLDAETMIPAATDAATAAATASTAASATAAATASSMPTATASATSSATNTIAPTTTPAPAVAQSVAPRTYLPYLQKSPTLPTPTLAPTPAPTNTIPAPLGPRVVHVRDQGATSWGGETAYWNFVNQTLVNEMVDEGLMALTGATTVADAWRALIPNYRAGQIVAIKINLNNSTSCDDADGQIDALVHPVNAIIRGLKLIGVPEAAICVFDASRRIPTQLVNGCLYSGVVFRDAGCRQGAGWSSTAVVFQPPAGVTMPPQTFLDNVVVGCSYLINMPILKPHGIAGVSLTFKNHFGDITNPWNLHDYIGLDWSQYRTDYNPLVDMFRSPHLGGKTVLILADALFAAKGFEAKPTTWSTFGNQVPNSVFLSVDPVAMDCVLCDFLEAELGLPAESDTYLALASQAGLGVYERGNPWGGGYGNIQYVRLT